MSNVLKVLQFIYDTGGQYKSGLKGGVRRLENLTNTWQLVAPYDESQTIFASSLIASGDITSDLISLAKETDGKQLTGADVVDPTDPNYQDYTDWLVWEGQITNRSLQKISKYRAGTIQVNFNVSDIVDGDDLIADLGTFGNASSTTTGDLPDPLTYAGDVGDYYRCNIPTYTSVNAGNVVYLYNEAAVWDGDSWEIGTYQVLMLNTDQKAVGVSSAVSPNADSLDPTDPLTSQITSKLNDHKARITVNEGLLGVGGVNFVKTALSTEYTESSTPDSDDNFYT